MEREELIDRLKGYEWNDVEFKEAQRGVPQSAYKTASAFANTEGGWLVFGVRDATAFEIVGVLEVDKVQNDFLSALRTGQRLNRVIASKEDLIEEEGKVLLVFHIPEARRQDKPVYLKRDIRQSFIRRGAGDERCTPTEIERMLRDAADERYDGDTLDLDPESCFDDDSLHWYRKLFEDRSSGEDEGLPHLDFLRNWGLVAEADGRLSPTRAAILLFGTARAFRQVLPRPVVDLQWHRGNWSEESADERWADRLVVETNLTSAWKALVDRYQQRAERPFSVDPGTLQREDRPLDYIAFREAAINLLIHQDYADHTRTPTVRFFDDRTTLWNPGDAYLSADELLEPGDREVRNPRIVGAFRRIGLSEQAGTGMRAIFHNWRQLGRVPPIVENDRTTKAFRVTLLNEELLSEEQLLFQASLGVHLDEAEACTFALACRQRTVRPLDVRAVAGLSGTAAKDVLKRLAVQGLISPLGGADAAIFGIAEHLRGRLDPTDQVTGKAQPAHEDMSTAQAGTGRDYLSTAQAGASTSNSPFSQSELAASLSTTQEKILRFCDTPRRLTEIMHELKLANRGYFKKRHLDPLLAGGVLRMSHPDQPKHPRQTYVLSEAGIALKSRRLTKANGPSGSNGA